MLNKPDQKQKDLFKKAMDNINKLDVPGVIEPGPNNLRCCTCGLAFGFRDSSGKPIRHRVVWDSETKTKIHICDRCLVLQTIAMERAKTKKKTRSYTDARREPDTTGVGTAK